MVEILREIEGRLLGLDKDGNLLLRGSKLIFSYDGTPVEVTSGGPLAGVYTYATLPAASSVSAGTSAYTSDVGPLTSNGVTWIPFVLVVPNVYTASRTLDLTDIRGVTMNVGSGNNVTIPPNSSVAFPVGAVIPVEQYGAGQSTLVAGSGVTIRSRGGILTLAAQYAVATIRKIATDEWLAAGDLA